MMRWIVGSSLKFRGLVVAIAAGVMVLGIVQLPRTPVDSLPEFSRPTVEVQTEALGLSAEEVEQLITVPLEQDLLNGVAFLERIESVSLPGLSSVVMTFEPGTDLLDARQVVAERLTQAVGVAGLPEVSKPPQMLQPLSSLSRVAMVRLSSPEQTPIEMSVLARWVIAPRLLGVEGVANVAIWGFRDRQLQVLVDPEKIRESNVTLSEVIGTTGNALEVSPLSYLEASSPGTGGWIETVNQRLHIFHEQAISTPSELEQVPLTDADGNAVFNGAQTVTLGDVTEVVEDHQPLIGDAYCRAPHEDCLLLVIEKFPGANTPEVARGVDAALEAMRPGLGGMELDTSIYRPAEHIGLSLDNLGWALLVGALLLLLVLIAYFFYWRTVLIAAVTVPLSLAAAGLVIHLRGVTVNTMLIAGLVLGLVAVVGDAVVDIDNVARRLRRQRMGEAGAPVWRTIIDASLEMRGALLYASLIAAAALVPILFTSGLAGAFLPPIAVSYTLAIAASLVVALTVTPALGMLLLADAPLDRRGSPALRALRRGYDRMSGRIVPRVGPAFLTLGALVVFGLLALPFLDTSLRPSLRERDVLVHVEAQPGTSLTSMDAVMAQAVDDLSALPGVRNVGAHVGRAITSDQIVNVNSGEIWVNVDPSANYAATLAAIDGAVDRFPDITHDVLTYSEQRVTHRVQRSEQGDLVVRVFGEDPEVLRATANDVQASVAGIIGLDGPRVELPPEKPTVEVEVDLAAAQRNGVKPGDVRRAAAILLSGITAGNLFEEQKVFDVVVWGAPEIRQDADDVSNLLIDTPGGGHVRLDEVADVRMASNPAAIRHDGVMTYIDVVADVSGANFDDVFDEVEDGVGQIDFPLEYHAEVLGDSEEGAAAGSLMLAVALAAAIGIFLLLQAAFTSWRLAVLAFAILPVALVGGVLAVLVTGATVTLGSVAGFVGVLTLAARGVVVLVRRYQHLERREGEPFGRDLVVRATREQTGPMLASALATVAVFAPFALAGDTIGFEIVQPMAIVVLGGLVTATLLNLTVVPAFYLRYGFVARPDTTGEDLIITIPDAVQTGPSS